VNVPGWLWGPRRHQATVEAAGWLAGGVAWVLLAGAASAGLAGAGALVCAGLHRVWPGVAAVGFGAWWLVTGGVAVAWLVVGAVRRAVVWR